ncbi:unnamed protein product, partial [Mesorhabditis belari]|uniref:Hypoxia up-regulated protein 1 n=1 Tax=Mesorhabditis belari TaxID=2138241 RepID=A0AAF3F8Z2_9BILA
MGASKTITTLVEYKIAKDKRDTKNPISPFWELAMIGLLLSQFIDRTLPLITKLWPKCTKRAERVKQVLSANLDHFAQIESVHEDIDMRLRVTREELNGLIVDLDERILAPIDGALEMAGLDYGSDLMQTRIGSKEIGRFLNTDESIALGGLYQAAFLSKGFKVKTFYVEELQIYPVQVHFHFEA